MDREGRAASLRSLRAGNRVFPGEYRNCRECACAWRDLPPFGAIFCHAQAHVMEDECGAPEMFTGGAKLVGVAGRAGKIAPADFKTVLGGFPRELEKPVQPAVLSLSQVANRAAHRVCPVVAGSSPISSTQELTMWAYCRVLKWSNSWRRLGKRSSSERKPASLIQAATASRVNW